MFQGKELEQLRLQKEQLVLKSDALRLRLTSEWQRLHSPGSWLGEVAGWAQRRPWLAAALAVVAGASAVRLLRKPGPIMGGIGRLGKLVSVGLVLWKWLQRKMRES
jgi:hypothetical protein